MSRERRLTKRGQFAAVSRGGTTHFSRLAILKTLPNGLEYNRHGFIVGRRVGKAVVRNRVRRLLKEGVRGIPPGRGWDVVVIARSEAARAGYHEIKMEVNRLFARAGLIEAEASR